MGDLTLDFPRLQKIHRLLCRGVQPGGIGRFGKDHDHPFVLLVRWALGIGSMKLVEDRMAVGIDRQHGFSTAVTRTQPLDLT